MTCHFKECNHIDQNRIYYLQKMKKYLLLIGLIILFWSNLAAQSCYIGSHRLETQQQVDNFPSNFPNCSILIGDLRIDHHLSDITNLDSLIQIKEIHGDLEIEKATLLESLSGLDSLNTITGELTISICHGLSDLEGLGNLITVDDKIEISFNQKLESLAGLHSLERNGTTLDISCNDNLTDVVFNSNFKNLNNLELFNNEKLSILSFDSAMLDIAGEIKLESNPNLIDINTFNTLDTVGSIYIEEMPLTDMSGFSNLSHVINSIFLTENEQLASLDGLENLITVGKDLQVIENSVINNLNGLVNLESIGGRLILEELPGLNSLQGLEGLAVVHNTVDLTQLPLIENLNGLDNLVEIGGSLLVEGNNGLTGLNGIENLESIGGNFSLKWNHSLQQFNTTLKFDSVGYNVNISRNDLIDLQGIESLEYIKGELRIEHENISSFNGLNNVQRLGGLFIEYTDVVNLDGLQNLDSITGSFELRSNALIENFEGLNNLKYIGGSFWVRSNPELINYVGLDNLEYVGFYFFAQFNLKLLNFEGLTELTRLGGLTVNTNRNLQSFDGLDNVTQFDHAINIYHNDVLTSIDGIRNIDPHHIELPAHYGPDMNIFSNPLLSRCHIESVCGVLSIPGKDVRINFNGTHCISNEMVIKYCDVCIEDITPPIAICQDIDVVMPPSQLSSITVDMIDDGSYDICSDLSDMYLDKYSFSCNDIGANEVELVVVDENGYQSSCVSIVTIEDPTEYCCPEVYELTIDPAVFGVFSASDTLKTATTISENGQITLRSGNIICLLPGFETQLGAIFETVSEDCSN